MRSIKKNSLLIVLVFAALFSLELWREKVAYHNASSALAQGCAQLRHGMTREEVWKILGAHQGRASGWPLESWFWDAEENQGVLWGWLGLNTVKGHFDVVVQFEQGFSEPGKVVGIYCGES